MKTKVYGLDGNESKRIELPNCFSEKYRPDVILKVYEAQKKNEKQVYSNYLLAGKKVSASGKIKHRRHRWRSHYGKGISRIPRKTMRARGTQFYWIGAFIPGTRGGYRAHPPKTLKRKLKLNRKEILLALKSAISATANKKIILSRYKKINELKLNFPVIITSEITKIKKTKELKKLIEKIFSGVKAIYKKKKVRAGKGKLRGRKYKKSAGLLIITGNDEKIIGENLFDIKKINEVNLKDLAPGGNPGRLIIYTEKTIKNLENLRNKK